jgi:hypothetical protein
VERVHGGRPSTRNEYAASWIETFELTGGWLPVRIPTQHYVTVDRPAAERVDLKNGPAGWTLTNGLGTPIRRLVFRDEAGVMHSFDGPIAPGVRVTGESAAQPLPAEPLLSLPLQDGGFQPRGTWWAQVESSPLVDPCGVAYEEVLAEHVILGVLDLAEAR